MTVITAHTRRDPRTLRRLEVNARVMPKEMYDRLVENIATDGALTSWPLIWLPPGGEEGTELILSGNHRVDAAQDAGLAEIDCILLDAPDLSRAEQIARQLSHNSIEGTDDTATLKLLYDEIDDINWRGYAGLDDKTLGLLDEAAAEALSEANLDYRSVMLVFLPAEAERASRAVKDARRIADEHWGAALMQYEGFMDALESVRGAYGVGNTATAFGVIVATFEGHLDELRAGWLREDGEPREEKRWVPTEAVLATRKIPSGSAAVIAAAIEKVMKAEGGPGKPWLALEYICADYLGGT